MSSRRAPLLLAVPVALLLLAGCVPTDNPGPSGSSTPSPSRSASPSASPSPTPDPTEAPADTSEPVTIGCNDLISRDQMYAFSPQFVLLDTFSPGSGSLAAEAVADEGLACRWVNETSGETIDVAVAHLLEPALAEKKASIQAFSKSGDAGVAQAVTGPFWVSAVSVVFFEAGDAAQLMDDATSSLG